MKKKQECDAFISVKLMIDDEIRGNKPNDACESLAIQFWLHFSHHQCN